MNLLQFFEKQKELDSYIITKKGLQDQKLLSEKILALLVELGEVANEWRGFKFWSEDQTPRSGKLLEEYIDCFHFILSIGLDLFKGDLLAIEYELKSIEAVKTDSVIQQFHRLYKSITLAAKKDKFCDLYYSLLFDSFLGLGEMFGFTWDQIEAAYNEKHRINIQRQNQGY